MPIERVVTDDMTTSAALICKGFPLAGVRGTARPGHYEFEHLVSAENRRSAEALMVKCRADYDFEVHLGAYESAHRQVREALRKRKETDYGNRHPRPPGGFPPGPLG